MKDVRIKGNGQKTVFSFILGMSANYHSFKRVKGTEVMAQLRAIAGC